MKKYNILNDILVRHKIFDAEDYVLSKESDAKMSRSKDMDVRMRGNVQMMMGKRTNRNLVDQRFRKLKYL